MRSSRGGAGCPRLRERSKLDLSPPWGTGLALSEEHRLRWRTYMRKTSLLGLVAVLAIVASLVIGPAASAKSAKPAQATAGTVVFIHDQEPPNLQGPWVGNNLYATSLV